MIPKYRAWLIKEKKMVNVDGINFKEEYIAFDNHKKLERMIIDYFENSKLMQSTGILDKNGKEIYEGDILKFDNTLGIVDELHKIQIGDIYDLLDTIVTEYEVEVIGNIYENEELL